MKYRWYSRDPSASQEAGFFIDEEDRILFWPNKRSHGYVLSDENVESVINIRSENQPFDYIIGSIFILLLISFMFYNFIYLPIFDLDSIINFYFQTVGLSSDNFSNISVFTIHSMSICLVIYVISRCLPDLSKNKKNARVMNSISGCDKIEVPKPKSKKIVYWPRWVSYLFIFLTLYLLIHVTTKIFMTFNSEAIIRVGDIYTAIFVQATLTIISFSIIKSLWIAVSVGDALFLHKPN